MGHYRAGARRVLPGLLAAGLLIAALGVWHARVSVAAAATYATIYDDAHLFTSTGRARIEQAAAQAYLRVTVVTTAQPFATETDWHHWLRGHSNDRGGVIIGIEARYHTVYVIPGPDSGLSVSNASRGVQDQIGQFNLTHFTDGVVGLIREYHALGAQSPLPVSPTVPTTFLCTAAHYNRSVGCAVADHAMTLAEAVTAYVVGYNPSADPASTVDAYRIVLLRPDGTTYPVATAYPDRLSQGSIIRLRLSDVWQSRSRSMARGTYDFVTEYARFTRALHYTLTIS